MTMLLILDGFGYSKKKNGNAIAQANMPTWRALVQRYPHMLLRASGGAVGLPNGFAGNSEVGHLCIGAGRVVRTSFCKLHDSINSGDFFENKLLCDRFRIIKENNRALHLLGLLSDAGVHSHEKHIHSTLRLAKQLGISKVFVHAFLDGRDTPPKSAAIYLKRLEDVMAKGGVGRIASIHGRFYAMDRDKNWDRVQKSYNVICGLSELEPNESCSWEKVLEDSYAKDITDEFIEPTLLDKAGALKSGDGMMFLNFRPDRARQFTEAFLNPDFDAFETCDLTSTGGTLAFIISATRYDDRFRAFKNDVLFEDQEIKNTLLDQIADKVFIIAETEKYAHVTYFFRGKVDVQRPNEERVLIPSKKVRTYVDNPCMSAKEITKRIIASLEQSPAEFYLVNYANCDMVGHSGDFMATMCACECVDEQLKILYKEIVEKRDGTIFLVGDHGNAEEMIVRETGGKKTSHTINPVPFVIMNKGLVGDYGSFDAQAEYGLAQVAPTILIYLGLKVPKEMGSALLG